ncbi:MAG: hypothetical protein CVT75_05460 [Alphaproteobacteria bacterium HGW-Alphaproteobacteria-14]|nr:MAG: hypothetical protein CVT75_05460 [Alphaproteobacteria bacterium HGW-Alphaproteobacteria-14]
MARDNPGMVWGDMVMSDENSGARGTSNSPASSSEGRRQADRRKSQQPFDGPDRRKADRRSGTDRRTTPRADGIVGEEE